MRYCSGAYVWFLLMSSLPHKEERFLFIIYPLICLACAFCISETHSLAVAFVSRCASSAKKDETESADKPEPLAAPTADKSKGKRKRRLCSVAGLLDIILHGLIPMVFVCLCVSRSSMVISGFSAPFRVYQTLYQIADQQTQRMGTQYVCVGKGETGSHSAPVPPLRLSWNPHKYCVSPTPVTLFLRHLCVGVSHKH